MNVCIVMNISFCYFMHFMVQPVTLELSSVLNFYFSNTCKLQFCFKHNKEFPKLQIGSETDLFSKCFLSL